MPGTERVREQLPQGISDDYIEERERRGWTLVAVEWQRPESEVAAATLRRTEVPYGLQVSEDFLHLEENPLEVETMVRMLDLIVEDRPLWEVAKDINTQGLRNRQGGEWTQSQIFDLLPRLIEVAPDIFGTDDWAQLRQLRKRRAPHAV